METKGLKHLYCGWVTSKFNPKIFLLYKYKTNTVLITTNSKLNICEKNAQGIKKKGKD